MPWVLIPGALRRIRASKKLSRKAAAEKCRLDERTLHRHETEGLAPRVLHESTVDCYCKGYEVDKEAFVWWSDHDQEATARKERSDKIKDPAAPKIATLTQRAKHELLVKAQKSIVVDGESLDVVGNAIIREIMNTFAPYEGRRFVVEGTIEDTDYIPEPTAVVLGGRYGNGARYRIGREVIKALPVYVTVFAPEAAHAVYLNECHRADRRVSVVVRVVVNTTGHPDKPDWKGFFIFEKKPVPRPWCFVVEAILPPVPTRT
jgi:hypothetical protein